MFVQPDMLSPVCVPLPGKRNRTRNPSFPVAAVVLLGMLSGCSLTQNDERQSAFIKDILKVVDSLPEDSDQQIHVLDSLFRLVGKPKVQDRLWAYDYKAAFYGRKGDYARGMLYADSIIALTEDRINNQDFATWYASGLATKGDVYMQLKRYDESFFYYTKARDIMATKAPDSCHSPGYLPRLANILYAQEKYRAAGSYYLQAYHKDTCHRSDFLKFAYRQAYLDNVGICYSKLSIWDSAEYYYDFALKYILGNEKKFPERESYVGIAKAVVTGNLAAVFAARNEFERAETAYLQSISATNTDDNDYTQNLLLELAEMYLQKDHFAQARQRLDEAGQSIARLPQEKMLLKYYRGEINYHKKFGDRELAGGFMEKYIGLKDSLEARDRQFVTTDARAELDNLLQAAINEGLKKDNELKTLYLVITLILSAMIVVFFSFVSYNYRRTAKLNRAFALKNERERISKELHDDLGSSLTCLQLLAMRLRNSRENSAEVLDSISQMSEEANDQLSEIVWMLNESSDTVNGLLAHLRVYMAEFIQRAGLDLARDFQNGCKDNSSIGALQRKNLLLSIKEIFHNTVKHARAEKFSLICHCEGERIRLVISDNGVGFSQRDAIAGNGIGSIRKRIRNIDGNISIESEKGVTVRIEAPLT